MDLISNKMVLRSFTKRSRSNEISNPHDQMGSRKRAKIVKNEVTICPLKPEVKPEPPQEIEIESTSVNKIEESLMIKSIRLQELGNELENVEQAFVKKRNYISVDLYEHIKTFGANIMLNQKIFQKQSLESRYSGSAPTNKFINKINGEYEKLEVIKHKFTTEAYELIGLVTRLPEELRKITQKLNAYFSVLLELRLEYKNYQKETKSSSERLNTVLAKETRRYTEINRRVMKMKACDKNL